MVIGGHSAHKSLDFSRDRRTSPIGEIATEVSPIGRTCCEKFALLRALVALCSENSETMSCGSCGRIDVCRYFI